MNSLSLQDALCGGKLDTETAPTQQQIKIDAGGLESTLAKFDFYAPSDECSTASMTSTSFLTLDSALKTPTAVQQVDTDKIPLTDAEKNLLKAITTPIGEYPTYERPEGDVMFIPVIESPGGSDKDPATGLRRDSVPIGSAIAETSQSAILFFLDETVPDTPQNAKESNAVLRRFLLQAATGVVVRVNPGTLSVVAQNSLEHMLGELAAAGVRVMTSPTVTRRMGAKDSLVKIRNLQCGLKDTMVYYDADSFREGFCQSIAFRPRVIKQNRGSQGEGIWICKLKDESQYCANFGDATVSLDTELVLTEANDNHVEYHTVGEFIEFAIEGRTPTSGTWASFGSGRYLDGGVEMGAMIVDQRFLPRIVEGEVRCNMIGDELTTLVHKIPQEGGLSATLSSGAVYTMYTPEDPKFASLVKALKEDLPNIMKELDMADEPLPLLWTADFIFDTDENGEDCFYVGEFNCSCVGITKDLELCRKVARSAISLCTR